MIVTGHVSAMKLAQPFNIKPSQMQQCFQKLLYHSGSQSMGELSLYAVGQDSVLEAFRWAAGSSKRSKYRVQGLSSFGRAGVTCPVTIDYHSQIAIPVDFCTYRKSSNKDRDSIRGRASDSSRGRGRYGQIKAGPRIQAGGKKRYR